MSRADPRAFAAFAAFAAFRPAVIGIALALWAVATGLIPVLPVISAARWLRGHAPRGFGRELWMIVFPAGMYATASMRIGAEAGLPPIRELSTAVAWVAAAVWAVVFAAMVTWPIARWRSARRTAPGRSEVAPRGPVHGLTGPSSRGGTIS